MKIAMVGTGYVGLVSGACFSEFGWDVVCVDLDAEKIKMLEAGEMPIYEPRLDDLVARNVAGGRLSFTTDLAAAVSGADAVFIAVGTPSRRGDGHADLSYVFQAAEDIARAADGYTVVVTKSTWPSSKVMNSKCWRIMMSQKKVLVRLPIAWLKRRRVMSTRPRTSLSCTST